MVSNETVCVYLTNEKICRENSLSLKSHVLARGRPVVQWWLGVVETEVWSSCAEKPRHKIYSQSASVRYHDRLILISY